jgi:hypothetical protein
MLLQSLLQATLLGGLLLFFHFGYTGFGGFATAIACPVCSTSAGATAIAAAAVVAVAAAAGVGGAVGGVTSTISMSEDKLTPCCCTDDAPVLAAPRTVAVAAAAFFPSWLHGVHGVAAAAASEPAAYFLHLGYMGFAPDNLPEPLSPLLVAACPLASILLAAVAGWAAWC